MSERQLQYQSQSPHNLTGYNSLNLPCFMQNLTEHVYLRRECTWEWFLINLCDLSRSLSIYVETLIAGANIIYSQLLFGLVIFNAHCISILYQECFIFMKLQIFKIIILHYQD